MRIDQHTPTMTLHDAVGNNVLTIKDLLRKAGYQSDIYAENIDSKLNKDVIQSSKYKGSKKDYILLHMSTASDFYDTISSLRSHKLMIYHNITPSKYFAEVGGAFYISTKKGLEQLKMLKDYVLAAAADSQFNAKELEEIGYKKVQVVPLAYDFKKKKNQENIELKNKIANKTNIIFVGRIVPNKCQNDIVKAFYMYNKYFNSNSHLYIIGGFDGMSFYKDRIMKLISKLNIIDKVSFTGKVSDDELNTYYTHSSLYLSMSEHEGFCVPAIECMHSGLPILAYYYSGALPETAGTGAIYFTKKKFFEVAAIMDNIMKNTELKKRLEVNQLEELKKFDTKLVEEKLLNFIKENV